MEYTELDRAVEAILFAAGEPIAGARMAAALDETAEAVNSSAQRLMDAYAFDRRGVRIVHLDDAWQMCSSGEFADAVARALETRKPPRLSQSLLETLTVVAYYQPVTKTYVEQIRGVDSSYSMTALQNRQLIEECGRLNVPGRPILYRTTPDFLRTFGLQSLDELPEIERMTLEVRPEEAEAMIVKDGEETPAEAKTPAETEA